MCGIYFFNNKEALVALRDTELAKSIPSAYEGTDVRREIYDVIYLLRSERGPLS